MTPNERKVIRIVVSPRAKAIVEKWAAEHDMKETGVASRIYEWFGRQPDYVQRAILGFYGDRQPQILRDILKELAEEPDRKQRRAGG